MRRSSVRVFLSSTLLAAACSPDATVHQPGVSRTRDALTFVTSGGVASLEAEHFTSNTAQGGHSWAQQSNGSASGGSTLLATPDNGAANNTGYVSTSPRLDFQVTFEQAGTYYVWVRGKASGANSWESDSIHVGLDGGAVDSADRISSFGTSFGWSRDTLDGSVATLSVATAGPHTVNAWMREDGFEVDKIVLTNSSGFTPTGLGPDETVDTGEPPTCTSETYEAESINQSTGGGVTGGWNIWSNGDVSTNHTFTAGSGNIVVTAQGEQALNVWPHMVVSIGGQQIGETTVTATSWTQYVFPYAASAGSQTVSVAFDNDYYDEAAGDDRNLLVDKFVVQCPTSCSDGETQPGTTSCGLNGNGTLDLVCVSGEWEDSTDCDDPDICINGTTQPGSTACGLNDNGALEQLCASGQWIDSTICDDPDECVNGSTQQGSTACGLNGNGVLEQVCSAGAWSDSASCLDPDVCVDGNTQNGTTPCGLNGNGTLDQICSAGQWQDTATCVDPDVCVNGDTQPTTTPCGLNDNGTIVSVCVTGQWQSSVCDDPDVCVNGTTQSGTTACGLNGRGTLDQICSAGQWLDTANCVDPDVCVDGGSMPGTTPCGFNGNGALELSCVLGQWQDSSICVDPDVCTNGTTQQGTTACGLNGRGTLQQLCSGGAWTDTATCVDPDVCVDGNTQPGTTACGLNGRGKLDQVCVLGAWTDSAVCVDPDECTDGTTTPGNGTCGLNGRGTPLLTCTTGSWEDLGVCDDPDLCVDDSMQPGTTACGLNGRGTLDQVCVVGNWQDTTECSDPDVCLDDDTGPGSTPCGLNGRGALDVVCNAGQWEDSTVCVDPDECVDDSVQTGSTPCGNNGSYEQQCQVGTWVDTPTCIEADFCGDGVCAQDENCNSCSADCGACPPDAFLEVNGQVVMEAENRDGAVSGSGHSWTVSGFGQASGGNTMLAGPDNGTAITSNVAGSSPRLDFQVSFTTTGTWTMWIRGRSNTSTGYASDSCWGGIDNTVISSYFDFPENGSLAWVNKTFNVGSPGVHTVSLWMREDGFYADKILLTTNGGYTPSDNGPAESPRGGAGVCGDGTCSPDEDCSTCASDCGACVICGDGTCNGSETCSTCSADCGACPVCGDGTCNGSESCSTCASDCGACPVCGDGTCNGAETCLSCNADCGSCGACGDGTCDPDETCGTCAADCGACVVWSNQDVGAVGAAGGMSLSNGTFTVDGSGSDINSTYGTVDEFHYVYQQLTGDATIVARVTSVENTHEWAKGGVMIRESLADNARYALISRRPDGQVQAQWRQTPNQDGTDSGTETGGSGTKWLRLERTGNTFRAFYSTDGTNFTQLDNTQTIAMTSTVYVGLAVTSHNDGSVCTAVFDNVSVTTPTVCGNGMCESGETCANCGSDCGACGACGDGTCDPDETCTSCSADCGSCPVPGLDTRPSNPTCLAPPPLGTTYSLTTLWQNISFSNPVKLVQPPNDDDVFIVVQRAGVARYVPRNATTSSQTHNFLNLGVNTSINGGLLSMAFHPDYANNGYVYVVYTINVGSAPMLRLSRFQTTDGGWTLNSGTEQIVLQHQRLEFNHNGGDIAFGNDGYLYMSSGDDAYLNYQRARQATNPNNWFGKMLRIDVDNGSPYSIPPDNPFASGGGAPEVYAYGLRNPWRFTIDRATGDVWEADVGEDTWEEINVIQPGQFYGWPYYEGDDCFDGTPSECSTPYTSPTTVIPNNGSSAISGGFVYRGAALPSLFGKYVFSDYGGGQVYVHDPATGVNTPLPGSTGGGAAVAWGEDNAGELYAVRYDTGRIQQLVASGGGGPTEFPALITDTGCFDPANPTQVVSGVIPYGIAQPFWSDGVDKERYLAIPDGTTISVGPDGDWVFPPGSVTIKSFRNNGQLFETRFFVRHADGSHSGYTYRWNDQQTQATLVGPGGEDRSLPGLEWSYPSRAQCFACHTNAANFNLGPETRQLNVDGFYPSTGRTSNQLYTLDFIGMLSGNVSSLAPLPAIDDASVPLQTRAEAYLHVNCSNCHRPGGPGVGPMDARFDTPFVDMGLCNVDPSLSDLGVPGAKMILPGNHDASVVYLRMSTRDGTSMPPLASKVVDGAGAALLEQWIDSLGGCQ